MCRLLLVSGKIEDKDSALILEEFRRLAEFGNVPRSAKPGHKDGWGFSAYKNGDLLFSAKNCEDAFSDPGYFEAAEKLEKMQPDIIIGHLRKASVGARDVNNTHPFTSGKYSFCQNGKIYRSENIRLEKDFESMAKGKTDSERLFLYILQALAGYEKADRSSIKKAIKKTADDIRKNFDFTALNMIFSDGEYIWVLREVNDKNEDVKMMDMMDYYSLFIGKGKCFLAASSEKLPVDGIKWENISNHELVEIRSASGKLRRFII